MSTDNKENVIQEAELDNTINPNDIVYDDDSDMPEPETKSYDKIIKCSPLFIEKFYAVVNELPYASILRNQNGAQIKLIDLVKYVEQKHQAMPVDEMDRIIAFIANIDFKHARPLMEYIEDKDKQSQLWSIAQ